MKIIYDDNDVLVVVKPRGLPTANLPKSPNEASLTNQVIYLYPAIKNVYGNDENNFSLLHRLDNDTEGLVLFAKNQASYDFLYRQQINNCIVKNYVAICYVDSPSLAPTDYSLPKWQQTLTMPIDNLAINFNCKFVKAMSKSSKVKAIAPYINTKSSTKIYTTDFNICTIDVYNTDKNNHQNNQYKVEASLTLGFRHQVRSSLLALGLPIVGDPIYNSNNKESRQFCFWANKISFKHPTTLENMVVEYDI